MTTWHRLGLKSELLARVPAAFTLDRWSVAVFHHEGQFRAISNACNHKGGPLCEGRLHGEFVLCPWHAWEYSVITGKGPEGYDEEQVPSSQWRSVRTAFTCGRRRCSRGSSSSTNRRTCSRPTPS